MLNYKEADSTQIWKYGYDDAKEQLHIVFTGNRRVLYVYDSVPRKIFDDFEASQSMGRFFGSFIKNIYQFHKHDFPQQHTENPEPGV